jgi:hypothetical protein
MLPRYICKDEVSGTEAHPNTGNLIIHSIRLYHSGLVSDCGTSIVEGYILARQGVVNEM